MSAVIAFEITEYLPQGFNFKGYTFNFKSDKIDETIEVFLLLIPLSNLVQEKQLNQNQHCQS